MPVGSYSCRVRKAISKTSSIPEPQSQYLVDSGKSEALMLTKPSAFSAEWIIISVCSDISTSVATLKFLLAITPGMIFANFSPGFQDKSKTNGQLRIVAICSSTVANGSFSA